MNSGKQAQFDLQEIEVSVQWVGNGERWS
jgi:hypothetical protein